MEEEDDTYLIQILRHLGSAEGEAFDECIINEANLMTDECSGRQGESKGVIECSAGEPPPPTGERHGGRLINAALNDAFASLSLCIF